MAGAILDRERTYPKTQRGPLRGQAVVGLGNQCAVRGAGGTILRAGSWSVRTLTWAVELLTGRIKLACSPLNCGSFSKNLRCSVLLHACASKG
ncbi:hypothetical protein NEUTE1DRAFT_103996 [Neurospora tetrasperma FGSC 2508]|uniref:Uncharacterized protein n=1 Tax=Neurospora tetrasperma (strain FGSC 2508 / ATCC MYA-4615 / P0657) TaxID=510951 RepID=F8MXS8_NEUT8|nr:uncharacterized protein NEUTE1DRAFT_103996 [Neurospora tetrasperma FGSC 2508]EGO54549.1 hypothetical protein NEUTE1DRAFT_103996 [Neurospora tetrasperma FGSC 2508]EGZ67998.1 hypothetical protein NEUTE2DRAFT_132651 [Neurospora tetrasperma FGSC 2509]